MQREAASQNKALAPIVNRLALLSLDDGRARVGCPPDLLAMAARFAPPVLTELFTRHSGRSVSVLLEPVAGLAPPPAPAPPVNAPPNSADAGEPAPARSAPPPHAPRAPLRTSAAGAKDDAPTTPLAPPAPPAAPAFVPGAKDDPRQHPLVRRVEQVLGARVRELRSPPGAATSPLPPSSPPSPPPPTS